MVCRGLGRSYGDASFNSAGRMVLTGRLNRMLHFDRTSGVLECEPGVTIGEIVDCFLPRGFVPPVLPGTKFVTVGGALACDIHGKNHHHDGSWARHMLDFTVLTAAGELVECSREENADLFWATVGGMGLTGIVTRIRMKLTPVKSAYLLVHHERTGTVEESLDLFQHSDDRYRYSVAWIDCLAGGRSMGRGVLMRANPLEVDETRSTRTRRRFSVPMLVPSGLLHRWSMKGFNALFYRMHPRRARSTRTHYEQYFFPLDRIRNWNRLYGKGGFLQYQCVIPSEHGATGLRRLLGPLGKVSHGSFLAVLKRFGAVEPEHLLSFPAPGYTLAVDLPHRGRSSLDLLDRLDATVAELGGRVYLAKDARLSAESLRSMYPRLDS